MFTKENLPIQKFDKNTINDTAILTLYREHIDIDNSKIITATGNDNTYVFLPKIIPQGVNLTKYVFKSKNNYIENVDTTDFKINKQATCYYDISVNAGCSIENGLIVLQLVDENDNIYNNGDMEIFYDIFTTSKIYKLTGIVNHNINDICKLRLQILQKDSPSTNVNIIISQINITINI